MKFIKDSLDNRLTYEEAVLEQALTRRRAEGSLPDILVVSYEAFEGITNSLGSKVQFADIETVDGNKYSSIKLYANLVAFYVTPDKSLSTYDCVSYYKPLSILESLRKERVR